MKSVICLLVLVAVVCTLALPVQQQQQKPVRAQQEHVQMFEAFIKKHAKHYDSAAEYRYRFDVFKKNMMRASQMNKLEGSEVYGATKFSDMTPEEFKSKMLMKNTPAPEYYYNNYDDCNSFDNSNPPASQDWRDASPSILTPVYNQGQCGSCWAFSATEEIESMWAIAGNALTSLSMQQIVSCDNSDDGCNGGWPWSAYQYVETIGGLESYSSYPYRSGSGITGRCMYKPPTVASISGYCYVSYTTQDLSRGSTMNETNMMSFVGNVGPLSICVDAASWQNYQGGVITVCGRSLDHCVQAVGYTEVKGQAAWIVRNSWGTDWGLEGYLYVALGSNTCGIAEQATTVLIDGSY